MMSYEIMSSIHERLSHWDEDALWDLIDAVEAELKRAEMFFKASDDAIRFIATDETGKKVLFTVSVETAHFILFDAEVQLDRFDDDEEFCWKEER